MATAYVAVGSNIEPQANARAALALLRHRTRVLAVSTFYRTEPIGPPNSPEFVNGVVRVQTDLAARELKLGVLRGIERALGRIRSEDRNAPRTIDLDLLVYDDLVVNEPDLVLPDPDIEKRAFLAVCLAELDPDLCLPGSGRRVGDIAESLAGGGMRPLVELSRILREETVDEQGTSRRPGPRTAD